MLRFALKLRVRSVARFFSRLTLTFRVRFVARFRSRLTLTFRVRFVARFRSRLAATLFRARTAWFLAMFCSRDMRIWFRLTTAFDLVRGAVICGRCRYAAVEL